MEKRILKLYYWDGMPNFGDALNPLLCKQLFDIEVQRSDPKSCDASFIGSLLDDFLSPNLFSRKAGNAPSAVKIWGSGFIGPMNTVVRRPFGLVEKYFRDVEVYAVRGKNSKSRLEKILNRSLEGCVIADPGLLVSMLVDTANVKKMYPLGIIPHHLEIHGYGSKMTFGKDCVKGLIPSHLKLDVPFYDKILDAVPGSVLIDMESDPLDCIQRIAECEFIVSAALHGLIAADSLGIPNKWITASDRLIGKDYKFRDYYSVFDVEMSTIDIGKTDLTCKDIDQLRQEYKIDRDCVERLKVALINSFPYKS